MIPSQQAIRRLATMQHTWMAIGTLMSITCLGRCCTCRKSALKESCLCWQAEASDNGCLPCLLGGFGMSQRSHRCCSALCVGSPCWFHSRSACTAHDHDDSKNLPEAVHTHGQTDICAFWSIHNHCSTGQVDRLLRTTASTAYVLSCWDNHLTTSSADFLPLSSAISSSLPSANSGACPNRMVGYFLI